MQMEIKGIANMHRKENNWEIYKEIYKENYRV